MLWEPALTIPSVGAFITGSPTTAHSFCPNNSANPPYYPPANIGTAANAQTDKLTNTNDSKHIYGASASQGNFSDIGLYQQSSSGTTTPGVPIGPCPPITGNPLAFTTALYQTPLTGITPTEIDGVAASPDSTVAFVLYNAAAATGLLPAYQPSTSSTPGTAGTLTNIQLTGTAAAPVSGIFSPDETIFFVGTSGDNLIHYINPVTLTDTQTINPGLTNPQGQAVPVQMMAVKPRSTT